MIQFSGKTEKGGRLVGIGLSDRNLELMAQARPIKIDVEKLLPDVELTILIFRGRTEEEMVANLRELGHWPYMNAPQD